MILQMSYLQDYLKNFIVFVVVTVLAVNQCHPAFDTNKYTSGN